MDEDEIYQCRCGWVGNPRKWWRERFVHHDKSMPPEYTYQCPDCGHTYTIGNPDVFIMDDVPVDELVEMAKARGLDTDPPPVEQMSYDEFIQALRDDLEWALHAE